jgi:hypothetical protein
VIPAVFVPLAALPFMPNGKLDRQALPLPDASNMLAAVAYAAPSTPIEERLCTMMAELLGVDRVGIYDDFFALGGNSMKAMQFSLQAQKEFGTNRIPVTGLFAAPNVAELAERVASAIEADRNNVKESAESKAEILLDELFGFRRSELSKVKQDLGRLPLVLLQANGSGLPLFLVHGSDGGVLPFSALAREFASNRPCSACRRAACITWARLSSPSRTLPPTTARRFGPNNPMAPI